MEDVPFAGHTKRMSYSLGASSSRAINAVTGQGLQIPDEPVFRMPALPEDITAVHGEELMVLFGQFESWLSFVEVQVAAAEIDEKYQATRLDEISAGIQIDNKGKAKTVSELKSLVMKDGEYIIQARIVQDAYAYRKVVETIFRRLDRAKFLISREITRRGYRD